MRLQSVELRVADVGAAAQFFEKVWGLHPAPGQGKAVRLRATAELPYVIQLEPGQPSLKSITFCGADKEREVKGLEGEMYRFVRENPVSSLPASRDQPMQLSHVVLTSANVEAAERFAVDKLAFKLTDRTRYMSFVRCNSTHHSLAYARSERAGLHHIAFEMQDIDAVMRGIGRMRDAGYPCVWGPGRHGPGNNVFSYFVGPHGGSIEYTAEVEEVGEDYRVGGPEDWKWPAGRTDQWGVAPRDDARLHAAECAFPWSA